MKHLHYGNLVISISNKLASAIQQSAAEMMAKGQSRVWPVSGYRDEREEISVHLAFGPGIPFAITDTWLPDGRPAARYDDDSIAYIENDRQALENEQLAHVPENVVVYGRFERTRQGKSAWVFSGVQGIDVAHTVGEAVQLLNENGYEVIAVTESGAPADNVAWSNMYIFGRHE